MGDGSSHANRDGCELRTVELAADRLADALRDATDQVFGISPMMLEIANQALKRVGVKLVPVKRG